MGHERADAVPAIAEGVVRRLPFAGAGRVRLTAAQSPIWESAGLAGLEVASSASVPGCERRLPQHWRESLVGSSSWAAARTTPTRLPSESLNHAALASIRRPSDAVLVSASLGES